MDDTTTYSAGIVHAYVKGADGVEHDIDAVISVAADPDVDETPVSGDDELKATFFSNQRLNISIVANSLSMKAFAAMTGTTVTNVAATTGEGATPAHKEIAGGTRAEMNVPYVEIGAVSVSQESDGNESHVVRIFHKVQCKRVSPNQENGSEMASSWDAVAYPTSADIEGNPLASRRTDTLRVVDGPFLG
jgi:hypothetical protein